MFETPHVAGGDRNLGGLVVGSTSFPSCSIRVPSVVLGTTKGFGCTPPKFRNKIPLLLLCARHHLSLAIRGSTGGSSAWVALVGIIRGCSTGPKP